MTARVPYVPAIPSLVRLEVQRLDDAHEVTGYGPHAHDFFQILVFDRGGGEHVVAGRAEPVQRGSAWFLPPGVVHDLAGIGEATGWMVIAGADALGLPPWGCTSGPGAVPWPSHPLVVPFASDPAGRPRALRLPGARLRRWTGWLTSMRVEVEGARYGYEHAVRALLHLVLVDAARDLPAPPDAAAHPLVDRALAIVDERFRSPLALADVARALAVTPGHLTETVRHATGRPLGAWIVERRLAEARRLLGETARPLAEVAAASGWADGGHFARQFRARHGVSPGRWRASLRTPDTHR